MRGAPGLRFDMDQTDTHWLLGQRQASAWREMSESFDQRHWYAGQMDYLSCNGAENKVFYQVHAARAHHDDVALVLHSMVGDRFRNLPDEHRSSVGHRAFSDRRHTPLRAARIRNRPPAPVSCSFFDVPIKRSFPCQAISICLALVFTRSGSVSYGEDDPTNASCAHKRQER